MGLCCFILLGRRHDVPMRRRGDVPLRRLGDIPPRRSLVFHLRRICDVTGTYRKTSLDHDDLLPDETYLIDDGSNDNKAKETKKYVIKQI